MISLIRVPLVRPGVAPGVIQYNVAADDILPPGAGASLEDFARTVDLLADTLLSHLSYEERELLHPLAQYGMG